VFTLQELQQDYVERGLQAERHIDGLTQRLTKAVSELGSTASAVGTFDALAPSCTSPQHGEAAGYAALASSPLCDELESPARLRDLLVQADAELRVCRGESDLFSSTIQQLMDDRAVLQSQLDGMHAMKCLLVSCRPGAVVSAFTWRPPRMHAVPPLFNIAMGMLTSLGFFMR
jgi:hypothetical protein